MMDLATGNVFRPPKITACTMKRMVIERVKLIVAKQGYKLLKFFNRKKEEMLSTPADMTEGVVRGDNAILYDEEFSQLPPLIFEGVKEEEDALDVNEGISNEKIEYLLSDSTNEGIQGVDLNANNLPPMIPDEEEEEKSESKNSENCISDQDSSSD